MIGLQFLLRITSLILSFADLKAFFCSCPCTSRRPSSSSGGSTFMPELVCMHACMHVVNTQVLDMF